jgi:hypothetical protein
MDHFLDFVFDKRLTSGRNGYNRGLLEKHRAAAAEWLVRYVDGGFTTARCNHPGDLDAAEVP